MYNDETSSFLLETLRNLKISKKGNASFEKNGYTERSVHSFDKSVITPTSTRRRRTQLNQSKFVTEDEKLTIKNIWKKYLDDDRRTKKEPRNAYKKRNHKIYTNRNETGSKKSFVSASNETLSKTDFILKKNKISKNSLENFFLEKKMRKTEIHNSEQMGGNEQTPFSNTAVLKENLHRIYKRNFPKKIKEYFRRSNVKSIHFTKDSINPSSLFLQKKSTILGKHFRSSTFKNPFSKSNISSFGYCSARSKLYANTKKTGSSSSSFSNQLIHHFDKSSIEISKIPSTLYSEFNRKMLHSSNEKFRTMSVIENNSVIPVKLYSSLQSKESTLKHNGMHKKNSNSECEDMHITSDWIPHIKDSNIYGIKRKKHIFQKNTRFSNDFQKRNHFRKGSKKDARKKIDPIKNILYDNTSVSNFYTKKKKNLLLRNGWTKTSSSNESILHLPYDSRWNKSNVYNESMEERSSHDFYLSEESKKQKMRGGRKIHGKSVIKRMNPFHNVETTKRNQVDVSEISISSAPREEMSNIEKMYLNDNTSIKKQGYSSLSMNSKHRTKKTFSIENNLGVNKFSPWKNKDAERKLNGSINKKGKRKKPLKETRKHSSEDNKKHETIRSYTSEKNSEGFGITNLYSRKSYEEKQRDIPKMKKQQKNKKKVEKKMEQKREMGSYEFMIKEMKEGSFNKRPMEKGYSTVRSEFSIRNKSIIRKDTLSNQWLKENKNKKKRKNNKKEQFGNTNHIKTINTKADSPVYSIDTETLKRDIEPHLEKKKNKKIKLLENGPKNHIDSNAYLKLSLEKNKYQNNIEVNESSKELKKILPKNQIKKATMIPLLKRNPLSKKVLPKESQSNRLIKIQKKKDRSYETIVPDAPSSVHSNSNFPLTSIKEASRKVKESPKKLKSPQKIHKIPIQRLLSKQDVQYENQLKCKSEKDFEDELSTDQKNSFHSVVNSEKETYRDFIKQEKKTRRKNTNTKKEKEQMKLTKPESPTSIKNKMKTKTKKETKKNKEHKKSKKLKKVDKEEYTKNEISLSNKSLSKLMNNNEKSIESSKEDFKTEESFIEEKVTEETEEGKVKSKSKNKVNLLNNVNETKSKIEGKKKKSKKKKRMNTTSASETVSEKFLNDKNMEKTISKDLTNITKLIVAMENIGINLSLEDKKEIYSSSEVESSFHKELKQSTEEVILEEDQKIKKSNKKNKTKKAKIQIKKSTSKETVESNKIFGTSESSALTVDFSNDIDNFYRKESKKVYNRNKKEKDSSTKKIKSICPGKNSSKIADQVVLNSDTDMDMELRKDFEKFLQKSMTKETLKITKHKKKKLETKLQIEKETTESSSNDTGKYKPPQKCKKNPKKSETAGVTIFELDSERENSSNKTNRKKSIRKRSNSQVIKKNHNPSEEEDNNTSSTEGDINKKQHTKKKLRRSKDSSKKTSLCIHTERKRKTEMLGTTSNSSHTNKTDKTNKTLENYEETQSSDINDEVKKKILFKLIKSFMDNIQLNRIRYSISSGSSAHSSYREKKRNSRKKRNGTNRNEEGNQKKKKTKESDKENEKSEEHNSKNGSIEIKNTNSESSSKKNVSYSVQGIDIMEPEKKQLPNNMKEHNDKESIEQPDVYTEEFQYEPYCTEGYSETEDEEEEEEEIKKSVQTFPYEMNVQNTYYNPNYSYSSNIHQGKNSLYSKKLKELNTSYSDGYKMSPTHSIYNNKNKTYSPVMDKSDYYKRFNSMNEGNPISDLRIFKTSVENLAKHSFIEDGINIPYSNSSSIHYVSPLENALHSNLWSSNDRNINKSANLTYSTNKVHLDSIYDDGPKKVTSSSNLIDLMKDKLNQGIARYHNNKYNELYELINKKEDANEMKMKEIFSILCEKGILNNSIKENDKFINKETINVKDQKLEIIPTNEIKQNELTNPKDDERIKENTEKKETVVSINNLPGTLPLTYLILRNYDENKKIHSNSGVQYNVKLKNSTKIREIQKIVMKEKEVFSRIERIHEFVESGYNKKKRKKYHNLIDKFIPFPTVKDAYNINTNKFLIANSMGVQRKEGFVIRNILARNKKELSHVKSNVNYAYKSKVPSLAPKQKNKFQSKFTYKEMSEGKGKNMSISSKLQMMGNLPSVPLEGKLANNPFIQLDREKQILSKAHLLIKRKILKDNKKSVFNSKVETSDVFQLEPLNLEPAKKLNKGLLISKSNHTTLRKSYHFKDYVTNNRDIQCLKKKYLVDFQAYMKKIKSYLYNSSESNQSEKDSLISIEDSVSLLPSFITKTKLSYIRGKGANKYQRNSKSIPNLETADSTKPVFSSDSVNYKLLRKKSEQKKAIYDNLRKNIANFKMYQNLKNKQRTIHVIPRKYSDNHINYSKVHTTIGMSKDKANMRVNNNELTIKLAKYNLRSWKNPIILKENTSNKKNSSSSFSMNGISNSSSIRSKSLYKYRKNFKDGEKASTGSSVVHPSLLKRYKYGTFIKTFQQPRKTLPKNQSIKSALLTDSMNIHTSQRKEEKEKVDKSEIINKMSIISDRHNLKHTGKMTERNKYHLNVVEKTKRLTSKHSVHIINSFLFKLKKSFMEEDSIRAKQILKTRTTPGYPPIKRVDERKGTKNVPLDQRRFISTRLEDKKKTSNPSATPKKKMTLSHKSEKLPKRKKSNMQTVVSSKSSKKKSTIKDMNVKELKETNIHPVSPNRDIIKGIPDSIPDILQYIKAFEVQSVKKNMTKEQKVEKKKTNREDRKDHLMKFQSKKVSNPKKKQSSKSERKTQRKNKDKISSLKKKSTRKKENNQSYKDMKKLDGQGIKERLEMLCESKKLSSLDIKIKSTSIHSLISIMKSNKENQKVQEKIAQPFSKPISISKPYSMESVFDSSLENSFTEDENEKNNELKLEKEVISNLMKGDSKLIEGLVQHILKDQITKRESFKKDKEGSKSAQTIIVGDPNIDNLKSIGKKKFHSKQTKNYLEKNPRLPKKINVYYKIDNSISDNVSTLRKNKIFEKRATTKKLSIQKPLTKKKKDSYIKEKKGKDKNMLPKVNLLKLRKEPTSEIVSASEKDSSSSYIKSLYSEQTSLYSSKLKQFKLKRDFHSINSIKMQHSISLDFSSYAPNSCSMSSHSKMKEILEEDKHEQTEHLIIQINIVTVYLHDVAINKWTIQNPCNIQITIFFSNDLTTIESNSVTNSFPAYFSSQYMGISLCAEIFKDMQCTKKPFQYFKLVVSCNKKKALLKKELKTVYSRIITMPATFTSYKLSRNKKYGMEVNSKNDSHYEKDGTIILGSV